MKRYSIFYGGRNVCISIFATLIVLFLETASHAQSSPNSASSIIANLQNRIYILGETSGGSPGEWHKLEQEAVLSVQKIAQSSPSSLIELGPEGQTPLMIAAQLGYAPVVEELLKHTIVKENLEVKGPSGTAWQQSMLAIRQALITCHPSVDNPFALIPHFVTQTYYFNRDPYPRVRQLLETAGAKHDMEVARENWMKICKDQSPAVREIMAKTDDVQKSAIQLGPTNLMKKMIKSKDK